ncbi:MAG: protein kinase [Actinomycetaceae bacterium]|nr:protein kinase [Actinomycetaceae bacterium]
MEIDGYELGEIIHVSRAGPLWSTTTPAGHRGLAQIRGAEEAGKLLPRWRAWARIDHPHVVALVDLVRQRDGRIVLVQEEIEGPTLQAALDNGLLRTVAQRQRTVKELRNGLAALHNAGIVHGDLSPSNVILSPERGAVIIDIADETSHEGGTPGWTVGLERNEDGDRKAIDAIATALGCESNGARWHAVSAPTDNPSDALRSAIQTAPTLAPKEALANRRGRFWRFAIAGAIVGGLGVGAYVMTESGMITPFFIGQSEAAAQSTQSLPMASDGQSEQIMSGVQTIAQKCLGEEDVRVRLKEIIEQRDAALVSADTTQLQAVLGADILRSDEELIRAMKAQDIQVNGLKTLIENVAIDTCRNGHVSIRADITQMAHQRCEKGECRTVPEEPQVPLRIYMEGNPLKVVGVEDGQSTTAAHAPRPRQ